MIQNIVVMTVYGGGGSHEDIYHRVDLLLNFPRPEHSLQPVDSSLIKSNKACLDNLTVKYLI